MTGGAVVLSSGITEGEIMKRFLVSWLAAAALGALALSSVAAADTKVDIVYTPVSDFLAAFVAKDQGFFAKNGVDYKRVTFIEVPFPQMNDVLKAGQVDGITSASPFYERAAAGKIGKPLGSFAPTLPDGTISTLYVSTRAWAEKSPQAVAGFRQALQEAVDFIKRDEKSARESLAKYTGRPPQVTASVILPNLQVKIVPGQIKFWVDVARERDIIKKDMDASGLVAAGF